MPKGESKPGERRGGRPKGRLNNATIERLERAQAAAAVDPAVAAVIVADAERRYEEARANSRKLGKERLEELMEIFLGATAYFQPRVQAGSTPNPNGDWETFEKWGRLAMECAKALAPYQSPTFRAIVVAPAPDAPTEKRKRFTLTIFEGDKPKGIASIEPMPSKLDEAG